MAEKIEGFSIELDLDHLSVDRGLKGLKDNLKTVNSEMKHNMSAFDRSERSVKKYETSLMGANKKLEVQKQAVAEAQKEYEKMVDEYGRGSKEAEKAAREYNNQAASLNSLEGYISRTKDELAKLEKEQRIANSNWTKMGDRMESFGGKLKTAGTKIDNVGSKMTKSITLPTFAATAAVGGLFGAFGWKRLTGLDSAQAKLKGLGYSAKDVERISKDVEQAIEGGMTTFAEGTDIAAGALAAGVKEGKELQKYIKLVGDAAVGANRPVADMAQIFNRVEGNGKLMTNELNTIEMSMPGFSKAMSKHLGVSSEKFREMVTDGEVSSKEFLKVMDGFAGDMAKEYSKSWDGMVANTKAYIGIIGESFLQGIFEDSKKSLADFIETLKSPEIQKRAAEMGEATRVAFGKMKDSIMGVVDWYQNLDDGQKTLIKRLGLMAVAGGPVLQLTGKLTSGLGTVLSVTGKLTKAIGIGKGAGLVAGLTSLGPAAIPALAVAGLATVAGGVYALTKKVREGKEVNLELAESFSDQAIELENSADTFDKLSDKAKISNAELAELNDLNERISQSSNPGEIEELQKQYDELAKKSGLSKDEIKELLTANETMIKLSPDVEKSISNQGNEFVTTTEAAKEYAETLFDLSERELEQERAKLLEQEADAIREINEQEKEREEINKRLDFLAESRNLTEGEINDKLSEAKDELRKSLKGSEERAYWQDRVNDLKDIENDKTAEAMENLQKEGEEIQKNIDKEQEKLDKLDITNQQMADVLLANIDINEEGEKGLEQLDKVIAESDKELAKLEEKLEKNGKLTTEEQEQYDALFKTNEEHRKTKEHINDELGLYKDINSLAELKLGDLDKEQQKKIKSLAKTSEIKVEEGNIVKQIEKKNDELLKERENLEENRKKNGANKKEIDKQISGIDEKIALNDVNIEKILKELGIWDQVKDSIATGTSNLGDQEGQLIKNHDWSVKGVKAESDRTREAAKSVTKEVKATDRGTIASIDRLATVQKSKRVNLTPGPTLMELNRDASRPVNKTVNLVGSGLAVGGWSKYAKGTPPGGHPEDGPAVVGDGGGSELVSLPSGRSFLSPSTDTLVNLPKGTHVTPHRETNRIMRSIKYYASGTKGFENSDLVRLLAINNKNEQPR